MGTTPVRGLEQLNHMPVRDERLALLEQDLPPLHKLQHPLERNLQKNAYTHEPDPDLFLTPSPPRPASPAPAQVDTGPLQGGLGSQK